MSAARRRIAQRSALAQWDAEGGALSDTAASHTPASATEAAPSNAELAHLRMRVIALENLVLAMLAAGPGHQLGSVREMAAFISPRAGRTAHPLTLAAAAQMVRLAARSADFRQPGGPRAAASRPSAA
jgi:hypothetical protein